jgi:hypothetical protein
MGPSRSRYVDVWSPLAPLLAVIFFQRRLIVKGSDFLMLEIEELIERAMLPKTPIVNCWRALLKPA